MVRVTNTVDTSCSASATVTINVDRNLASPQFTKTLYTAEIPETLEYGSQVLSVLATDGDRLVRHI